MKRYIKPVARKAGIHQNKHTFRRSLGTLLKANGEDVKTVQVGLPPWLRQTDKTLFAVRCEILDRQDHSIAF